MHSLQSLLTVVTFYVTVVTFYVLVIFGRPFVKRFALSYRTVVLSVCPVCLVCPLCPLCPLSPVSL